MPKNKTSVLQKFADIADFLNLDKLPGVSTLSTVSDLLGISDHLNKNDLRKFFIELNKNLKKYNPPKDTESDNGGGSTAALNADFTALKNTLNSLERENKLQQDQIYDLLEQLKPKPVPSAAEVRAILGDTSSVQSITDDYNKATNEFYDNMKAGQQKNWNQATRSNLLYTDNVANQYLNSYANTAPTQANKAMVGANNLMSQLGNNNINAQAENAMLDQINMLDESRKAELANNPYYAEKRWNDKNAYYGQLGANYNKEDVRQYVAKQNALTEKAIAGSALQGQLAHANATKYSGLMNYRGSQAGAAASAYNGINNSLSGLYNLYTRLRGKPAGGSMLDEILDNSQGSK